MGKKNNQTENAGKDPNLDPEGAQSTTVDKAPEGDQTPGETNTSTEKETSAAGEQTDTQSTEESTTNTEKPEDTGVDKKGKGKTTSTKGTPSKSLQSEIEAIAKKTFDKHPLDTLYFTSDLQGFSNPQDANYHANRLADKAVYEVKKSEDEK